MSLILEALKKSEQQRQREKAPSLQSIHQPTSVVSKPTKQPWWLLGIFIVICNFAFFGYWLWRQQNMSGPAAETTSAAQAASNTAPSSATEVNAPTNNSNTSVAAVQSPSTQMQGSQPEFTQISPRGAITPSAPIETAPRIQEINELPDSVRNNLPAMTFSFHVYSENPEQRTIIINDRRVREGEEFSSGLRLQAITPDGVILLFEQHHIHISVLSDW